MRLHIDTLLGHIGHQSSLPTPATDQDKKEWKYNTNLDYLDVSPSTSVPATSTTASSYTDANGPQHPKATPNQLAVMKVMMQAVGVSSFRPDFSESPSSTNNQWLWKLALRIFIKLVECGEYVGVSLQEKDLQSIKKIMDVRVRSLMKKCVHSLL